MEVESKRLNTVASLSLFGEKMNLEGLYGSLHQSTKQTFQKKIKAKKRGGKSTSLPAICYFTCNIKRFFQVYCVWYGLQWKPHIPITWGLGKYQKFIRSMNNRYNAKYWGMNELQGEVVNCQSNIMIIKFKLKYLESSLGFLSIEELPKFILHSERPNF